MIKSKVCGGCSSVVRALVCGTRGRGCESPHPPNKLEVLLEDFQNIRQKKYQADNY